MLYVSGWLSHLELSWELSEERAFCERLAEGCRLVRYDRAGCGLSPYPSHRRADQPYTLNCEEPVIRAGGGDDELRGAGREQVGAETSRRATDADRPFDPGGVAPDVGAPAGQDVAAVAQLVRRAEAVPRRRVLAV